MPDDTDNEVAAPATVGKSRCGLVKYIKSLQSESGGGKSWVSTILILSIVAIAAAIYAWVIGRQNRELAQLRHEHAKGKILADKSIVDQGVAVAAEQIKILDKIAEQHKLEVGRLDVEITLLEAQRNADKQAIDRIRSWRTTPPGNW